jgi:2-keto-4-pentenoate hydratase/2-oxohepta-3-ene-1,7-dioic acid hydratase in catechol pathway
VFVARVGQDIPRGQARKYIAAYTIFNDFSARDIQLREMQGRLEPAKGKDFDTGNAMGPYLVTLNEVPDPYNLTMIARVNGEEWSRGSSADMHYKFEDIISYISQDETLYPGEFIGSGTVGNGCGLELDRWLSPGDVVELEVERLGVLRNRVVRPTSPQ